MSGYPANGDGESGGFCPEPSLEDRFDVDDRDREWGACDEFRPWQPRSEYCVCGIHRSWHKEQKP